MEVDSNHLWKDWSLFQIAPFVLTTYKHENGTRLNSQILNMLK